MIGPDLDIELDPLLEALESSFEGPAVTAIGGGHGLAQALAAVQTYAGRITAVVGVTDDGGSSGRLAPAMDIPPPGDIRRCLLALTPEPTVWSDLLGYRFEEGDVKGHSLGNLVLAALAEITGDFEEALRIAERHLGAVGQVVPTALHRLNLEAVVDGRVVAGQLQIAIGRGKITALRLAPEDVVANPRAIEAVVAADQVILGPGSLYTSTIAALLPPGLVDALNASPAQLIYVCNLITQDGETLGMDAIEHLGALTGLAGLRMPDAIVANASELTVTPPLQPVRVDPDALEKLGIDLVQEELAETGTDWPRHDPGRLGAVLGRLASA